jgi:phospholipid transport system substrate-binding protein
MVLRAAGQITPATPAQIHPVCYKRLSMEKVCMRRWGVAVAAAGALLVVAAQARAEARSPRDVVDTLDAALLDVLKRGQALGYQGRFDRLKPVMQQSFDLAFMAEKSIGSHWKSLGDTDRAGWVALFGDFTVANYAANFDRFTGQRFEVVGEEPAASGTRLVRTRVVTPGADSVELAYRLRDSGGRWAIADVYLKGTVSELALRRSDYASVLGRDGFEGLLATIREKIADLAAGRGKRERM